MRMIFSPHQRQLLLGLIANLVLASFGLIMVPSVQAAATYGSGVYTNLCGTGTAATANTCNKGCNSATGTCSVGSGNRVVRYACAGRHDQCTANESSFQNSQNLNGISCGTTVQIDVFNKTCRDSAGNWNCTTNDLQDYLVWYSGDCPAPQPSQAPNCASQMPINTQFRKSGESAWISGNDLNQRTLRPGDHIDVNCFAQNGSTLLENAVIDVRLPNGTTAQAANTGELRNYTLSADPGIYSFTCRSTTINNCRDTDSVRIRATAPTTPPTSHQSSCDNLIVAGGNNNQVPAQITLRAQASDSQGSVQRYRFYFGDGQQTETDNPEVTHTYQISGTFTARVDAKDSRGNWQTADRCQTQVTVRNSAVESHKSGCSDVFITADNNGQAPATVKFQVTGYDNKGDLQRYKIDFGNGITKESDGNTLEQRYETPGTFTIKAFVQDSNGDWKGGDQSCQRTLYVTTQPLQVQPSTGTPTMFSMIGLGSGIVGLILTATRRLSFRIHA